MLFFEHVANALFIPAVVCTIPALSRQPDVSGSRTPRRWPTEIRPIATDRWDLCSQVVSLSHSMTWLTHREPRSDAGSMPRQLLLLGMTYFMLSLAESASVVRNY